MNADFVWEIRIGDRIDVIYNPSYNYCAIGLVTDKIYPNILKITYYNAFEEQIPITVDVSELPYFVDLKKLNTLTPYHSYLSNRTIPQCINVDPKLTAKCRICNRFCCAICALFKCEWEMDNQYQCETCTINAEYSTIFQALSDIFNNKNVYFDQNVIHILTQYSMGTSVECNNCQSEIVCDNQYQFETNVNQNGKSFHKYLILHDNIKKNDKEIVNVIYRQNRRVFCDNCCVATVLQQCEHRSGQCKNFHVVDQDTDGLCMNHPFCSRCGKRLNYFLPSKCKKCFKSICRNDLNCSKHGYCTGCWKR
eukprot:445913_1